MSEPITRSPDHQITSDRALARLIQDENLNLRELEREVLPPLADLQREHAQMRAEIEAAEARRRGIRSWL